MCSHRLTGLHADTEYSVRVCGMRITGSDGDEVVGIPSVETVFKTLPLNLPSDGAVGSGRSSSTSGTDNGLLMSRWTDQQCAVVLLLVFALCALLIAFLAQQMVLYSTSGSDEMADPPPHTDARRPI